MALKETILSLIKSEVPKAFPHLSDPIILMARVAKATKIAEGWSQTKIVLSGIQHEAEIYTPLWQYNLKIINKNGNRDERYPELLSIRSPLEIPMGKLVAIGLLQGDLSRAYIIGEVFS